METTFGNLKISHERLAHVYEMLDKLITGVMTKEELKESFGLLVFDLFSSPRTEMHERYEEWIKPITDAKQRKKEQDVLDYFDVWRQGGGLCGMLRIDIVRDLHGKEETIATIAKYEMKHIDRKNVMIFYDSWEIVKSRTPDAYATIKQRCPMIDTTIPY